MSRKRLFGFSCHVFAVAMVISLFGCGGPSIRAKDDTEALRMELRRARTNDERTRVLQPNRLSSIGDAAHVLGLEPLPCTGIGLVTGLGENGADKSGIDVGIKDDLRKALMVEEGRTQMEARMMLEGRDSSIVQVTAEIPPGAAVGALIDAYVRPIDSAVSLQGGYLHKTALKDFVITKEGDTIYRRIISKAQGPVAVASTGSGSVVTAQESGRSGVVYDGACYEDERVLVLFPPRRSATGSIAVLIEYLVNRRFGNTGRGPGMPPITYATAMQNKTVAVRVPAIYRRDVQRFADTIRQIRGAYYYGAPAPEQLEKVSSRLCDGKPKDRYQASVELEAVGPDSIPYLESVLDKGDEWTGLYAAQALSYLDSPRGAEKIYGLVNSSSEAIRMEAVKFAGQLAGRRAVQVLREKLFDSSGRVALEAVSGLIAAGEQGAARIRLWQLDIVAVPGTPGGLIVKSQGRPMIIVTGLGTPLRGPVAINVAGIGIGSTDDDHVGIVTGQAPDISSVEVEATADNVLAVIARMNPPFEAVRKVIQALEDSGNMPYKIRWLD